MKDSTTFISYQEFEERFGIKLSLAFQGLISALKTLKQKNSVCVLGRNKNHEDFHEQVLKTDKANKAV